MMETKSCGYDNVAEGVTSQRAHEIWRLNGFLFCPACGAALNAEGGRSESRATTLRRAQIDEAVRKALGPVAWKDKTRRFYNDSFERGVKAVADYLYAVIVSENDGEDATLAEQKAHAREGWHKCENPACVTARNEMYPDLAPRAASPESEKGE